MKSKEIDRVTSKFPITYSGFFMVSPLREIAFKLMGVSWVFRKTVKEALFS